jgi:ketosteroid isomerase-like protein
MLSPHNKSGKGKKNNMSVNEIKAMVKRFVDEPWNKGHVDIIDELCSPKYTVRYGTQSKAAGGRDFIKKAIVAARAESPDFKATVKEIIVEGNRVAYEWEMSGTDKQGKLKTNIGITILKIRDGKIVEDRFISGEVKPE